ncbi:helix-turn-helix domain-containing protein [Haemophilus parainfluenzae]|uniref:Transcriptional regulator n=1 Tax=Haemophilus parainfluenzae TaxID=729 RepID=A0AB36ILG9_HAEPA|nr:helix-turn-helix transcriptional regulator [Haemophilus parainfluenzae]OLV26024.1 transcriptional regulator [Haemophilus parainfluenzae]
MCISERLKQVLDAKNMTVTEFSNVTGISYRSAMNYLNEGRDPNVDALVKIHKGLGVSITWLLTGMGEVFEPVKQESSISNQEKELLSYYQIMPKSLQEAIKLSFKEIYKVTSNLKK